MRHRTAKFGLAALLCLAVTAGHAQSVGYTAQSADQPQSPGQAQTAGQPMAADSLTGKTGKLTNFPSGLFGRIQSQMASMNQQLTHQTVKYLQRMGRQEERLKSQLYRRDSLQAARLYPSDPNRNGPNPNDPKQQYAALAQKFKQDSTKTFTSMGPEYLPHADSTRGALAFLTKNPSLINANPALQARMQGALTQMQQLQAKLQQADVIKQYIATRKAQIQQYLSANPHLPSGITNTFQGYNKQAFYYADQVRQYRSMLDDPDKMMQTAMGLLNKVPAFTSFMQKNSFLAGLFGVPAGYGTDEGMVGMQTRSQVLAMVQRAAGQASAGGAGGEGGTGGLGGQGVAGGEGGLGGLSAIQQSLQTAQQDISKMQNKLSSLGAGSGGMDMPNFPVNDQKKKTFLGRLEVGVNFQTSPTTNYYPTTANFGVSLGYKLGHNNTVGIGAAYKLGLGEGFQHMALSSQGVGLRSFLNVTVKKTWGVMGGFEYNYQQPFSSYQDIRNLSAWTKSSLIGITKTVSMHSAVFRKTQVQLLWDFLSYSQVPKTSPVLFRVAYSF